MSDIQDWADKLHMLSTYIRSGRCSLTNIPFDNIIKMVEMGYQQAGYDSEQFVLLCGNIISKGIVQKDMETIADIVELMAKHLEIIGDKVSSEERNRQMIFRLHTNYLYYANCLKNLECDVDHESISTIKPPFEGKGVVYSAITGNYDVVKEPKYVNPNLDYILFTNNPDIKSDTWKGVQVSNEEQLDNVRLARKIKIMGHLYLSGYDYSIWVDGKLEITDDLEKYVLENRKTKPILCMNHYYNDCVYVEKEACCSLGKDDPIIMEKQILRYREEGYPEHNGMIDSCFLVREVNNPDVKQLMETWWSEVLHGSRRDQLSFNYACWKNEMLYDTTLLTLIDNKYIKQYRHN